MVKPMRPVRRIGPLALNIPIIISQGGFLISLLAVCKQLGKL